MVFSIVLSMFCSLSSVAEAVPFHTLSVSPLSETVYKIDETSYTVLPKVVLQTSNPQAFAHKHPNLVLEPLGPKGTKSFAISVSTAQNAIKLAGELSKEQWNVWVDVALPKTPHTTFDFSDPHYTGQWYVERLEMPTLWAESLGSADIRVAIIDSGIDISHPDLSDKSLNPYDAYDDDADPSPNPGEYCWSGGNGICDEHGTAVAGIAVAAQNDAGIVGLCPECTLIPIKMLGDGVSAMSSDIASFEHSIANDAAVINNSWGYTQVVAAPQPLVSVIERAQTETRNGLGSVVVFAAGNDNREVEDGELCDIDGILCVSAVDSYGRPTAYTNFGPSINVAAPSATVSIAPNESLTTNFGGTSAAAPVVSGLAAWILSVRPDLSSAEVIDLILRTAEQSPLITPDENGHHDKYGFGEVSALNIHAELFPPEVEEPQKGGCSTLAVPPSSVMISQIMPFLLGLMVWVRRR